MHLFLYGDDWVRHLSSLINERSDLGVTADYCEYPEINPLRIAVKVMRADILMRVGVRPGAPGKRLFLLDCMWSIFSRLFRHKRIVYYWIGTDVLDAVRERRAGGGRFCGGGGRRHAIHFANAPWLVDELLGIGITSKLVLFPSGRLSPPTLESIEWSARFTVLTYIPDGRSVFYGGDALLIAAKRLPQIRFLVVGGHGTWVHDKPSNIDFQGYVNDMGRVMNQAHVVVRQVEHDAIGGTVREGLFYARHVIYSYPMPHTEHVGWGKVEELCDRLEKLSAQFQRGELRPNLVGREYATMQWDPKKLLSAFLDGLIALPVSSIAGKAP